MYNEEFVNTSSDPKFSKLEVGDQVIAIRGYALRPNSPAPGDRGFIVACNVTEHAISGYNVSVKFFGFKEAYDFHPSFLQKISNSQPVIEDYYARTREKALEWLFKHGYNLHDSTTVQQLAWGVEGGGQFQLEELLCSYMMDLDDEFDPTECEPSLRWQIEHLKGCMEVYKELYEHTRTASITELAVDNPNLAEYAKHWEGRAETAEKNLEMMTVIANTMAEKLEGEEAVTGILKTLLDGQLRINETLKARVVIMEKEAIDRNEQLENSRQDADYQRTQVGRRNDEIEKLQVQLAGCSVAALGGTSNPAKSGDYGWSPAYQDVLNLREVADLWSRLVESKCKELDEYVDIAKHKGDEIENLRSKLFETTRRNTQLSDWLNEAAKELNCDLDQVGEAIRKLKQAW